MFICIILVVTAFFHNSLWFLLTGELQFLWKGMRYSNGIVLYTTFVYVFISGGELGKHTETCFIRSQ